MENKAIHLRVSLKSNASYIIDDETFEDATYEQLVARLKVDLEQRDSHICIRHG